MGVHPFRDPRSSTSSRAEGRDRRDEPHVYAVDWQPGRVEFFVDDEPQVVQQAPAYPLQIILAVFDFPDKATAAPAHHVPELAVDWVRGR